MAMSNDIQWKRIAAEGFAIVVSILLAFGIEAWWQDRNELDLEQRLLTALLVEFEQNEELLRQATEEYERRYQDAVRVLELVEEYPAAIDETEFESLVASLLRSRTFHFKTGAHDGLLASGELSLIRDETLRNKLASWPSYVAEWSEEEDAVFSFAKEAMVPFLSEWIRLRRVKKAFPPIANGKPLPPIPAVSQDAASLAPLMSSAEFDNLVYQRAQGTWHALSDGEILRVQLSEIVQLIEQNLE